MNTILQKRIEEAAMRYAESEVAKMDNSSYSMHERKRLKMFDGYDLEEALTTFTEKVLQNQWISVEEALPYYEENVIVADKINGDYEYYFNHRSDNPDVIKDKNGFCSYRWQNDEQITHWMCVPSLEGGEK